MKRPATTLATAASKPAAPAAKRESKSTPRSSTTPAASKPAEASASSSTSRTTLVFIVVAAVLVFLTTTASDSTVSSSSSSSGSSSSSSSSSSSVSSFFSSAFWWLHQTGSEQSGWSGFSLGATFYLDSSLSESEQQQQNQQHNQPPHASARDVALAEFRQWRRRLFNATFECVFNRVEPRVESTKIASLFDAFRSSISLSPPPPSSLTAPNAQRDDEAFAALLASSTSSALQRQNDELIELGSLDEQHEHFVVRPWMRVERALGGDYRVIRAVAACLRGGGLGLDKPHSEQHWAQRAGGENEHVFFFPLHGGVSPRRVLRHALRSSEYLGIDELTNSWSKSIGDLYGVEYLKSLRMPASLDLTFFAAAVTRENSNSNNNNGNNDDKNRHSASNGRQNDVLVIDDRLSNSANADEIEDEDYVNAVEVSRKNVKKKWWSKPTVVVDLGCGHGAMLAAMCPPHPRLWCYGVDFTDALIRRGQRAFPHLDLRPGIAAPHIATGAADAVLSNGVLGVIRFSETCKHLREIVRLLRPGRGIALFWQVSTSTWARYHPSFFAADDDFFLGTESEQREFAPAWGDVVVDPFFELQQYQQQQQQNDDAVLLADDPEKQARRRMQRKSKARVRRIPSSNVLSRCPGKLWRFIDRVDVIAKDKDAPLYSPTWYYTEKGLPLKNWPGTFGIRIFRNSKIFDPAVVSSSSSSSISTDNAPSSSPSSVENDDEQQRQQNLKTTQQPPPPPPPPGKRHRNRNRHHNSNNNNENKINNDHNKNNNHHHVRSFVKQKSKDEQKRSDDHMANVDVVGGLASTIPVRLDAPEGLFLLMKYAAANKSSLLRRERKRHRKAMDDALRCVVYDRKKSAGGGGGGWCSEQREFWKLK